MTTLSTTSPPMEMFLLVEAVDFFLGVMRSQKNFQSRNARANYSASIDHWFESVNDEYHDERGLLIADGKYIARRYTRSPSCLLAMNNSAGHPKHFATHLTEKSIAFRILIELL